MFRKNSEVQNANEVKFDLCAEHRYAEEDEERDFKRYIPWLVAVAITAAALVALSQGYFA